MKPGDFVVIELGINDPGTPTNGSTSTTGDKGRADCPGAGSETCTVIFKYAHPDLIDTREAYKG
jgi:rhamnogalacturonan acetylesterase